MSAAPPSARPFALPLAAIAAAFAWGFAEATLFFIVADVLLTFIAVALGLRVALRAALAAAIGAACGGLVMWRYGVSDPAAATALLAAVPFVSPAMVATGMAGMAEVNWPLAMLKGSVTGIPYKVYAVAAGKEGLTALLFFGITIPVRLARFALAASVVAAISALLRRRLDLRRRLMLLATFWVLFYGEFWWRWMS
ncbi:hypothetical protein [Kaistia nematophila]|uniref:Uncharacterized protein n=1 Tax=Kaistia nematophila TaxID=2994654 RepID=A0A9X3E5F9_9HYPH|nr:hypothetical protein [Kaistia nematophila]MCX5572214.1 hypothetical protein [Kaistia nematophila]